MTNVHIKLRTHEGRKIEGLDRIQRIISKMQEKLQPSICNPKMYCTQIDLVTLQMDINFKIYHVRLLVGMPLL